MRLGPWEIALIVMFVIVLFGARKIPEIMRGFGSGIKEFKKGMKEEDAESASAGPTPPMNSGPNGRPPEGK
ncbi:MAG: twin-arginine translocase TatA/TatE family subunit [Calditrichaeota bacterium]|nr:twin-arginine translocase TatA/TatE family subunit [Calditrichota bacterium]